MELHIELAQAVAALEALQQVCEPSDVTRWQPSPEERLNYIEKCEQVLAALDRLQIHESRQVFAQGQVQAYFPGPLLHDIRHELVPSQANIWAALV
jgi:hypothetical protein